MQDFVFTDRLVGAMKEKGYTYRTLAPHLNYRSPASVLNLFTGRTMPTLDKMRLVSDVLGRPMDYFFALNNQD